MSHIHKFNFLVTTFKKVKVPWRNHNLKRYIYPNVYHSTIYNTIARTWKQHRCQLTDEWIKKMWYIYTMEYYSAIKRNKIDSVVVIWIKLESVIQSETSQKEENKYRILRHIYGEGNGTPLQYSCLENPTDGGAW